MRCDSVIEVGLLLYPEGDDEIDVEVTLAKLQIVFGKIGFVRCDVDTDDVAFDFVAETVGFCLVESDDEITQAIDGALKRLLRVEEGNGGRIAPEKTAVALFSSLLSIRVKLSAAASASTDGSCDTVTRIVVDFLILSTIADFEFDVSIFFFVYLSYCHHCSIRVIKRSRMIRMIFTDYNRYGIVGC